MKRQALSFVLLSLALTGCASWSLPHAESSEQKSENVSDWWLAFEDDALNALMTQVSEQNLTYKIAEARLREAQAQASASRGALFSSVDAVGNANRGERGVPRLAGSVDAGLQAQWDLDLFGVNRNTSAAAGLRADQASYNQVDALRLIRAELAVGVIDQRGLAEQKQLLLQLVSNTALAVSLTQDLTRVGLVGPDSLAQQKAQAAAAQQRLHNAEAALAETGFRLARLMAVSESIVLPGSALIQVPTPTETLGVSLTHLQQRPDVAAARAGYLASQRDAAAADATLWPRLTLGGFFGVQENTRGSMPLAGNPVWSVTSGLTAPILNFGQLRANARAAQARSEAAVLQYQDVSNRAVEEARVALTNYLEGINASLSAKEAFVREENVTQTVIERYRRGLVNQLEVLASDNARIERALQAELAVRQARTAYVYTWRALGQ